MISRLLRIKAFRFATYAAGAVVVAGSAVYVASAASSPSPSSKPPEASAVCQNFMNHFAANLGTDQSKVNAAFQQAVEQTLADEVKAGKLTQKEADAIKARIGTEAPCSLPARFRPNKGELRFFSQQIIAAAASALDLSPDQLKADLKNGESLSQIAAAHNPPITEAQFRSKLLAAIKPKLDQAVSDKKLTAEQEQKILDRIQNGPIPFWDKAPKHKTAATPTAQSPSLSLAGTA